MEQLTEQEREALAELLATNQEYRTTPLQRQALCKVLQSKLHPVSVNPATATIGVVDEARISIPECDCGRTNEPWHPKRGKCKGSLGGVKL